MNYRDEALKEIMGIFRRELGDENLLIDFASSPGSIEKWDSINNLMLLNRIEEAFGVSFPTEVIFKIETVGDICDYLVKARNLD